MSRAGYWDDPCGWELDFWRQAVANATRGKRGQAFLRDLLGALDEMPNKRLIVNELIAEGETCAIGSLGVARGIDMDQIDPYDRDFVAKTFGIAPALVAEVEYMNDEGASRSETPEQRWVRMREWVASQIEELA